MAINRIHIDNVFGQRFSLYDQKTLEKYFEDRDLNEEAKQILREQWEQFRAVNDGLPNLDHVYHKLYYSISSTTPPVGRKNTKSFGLVQIAAILVVGLFIASSVYLIRGNIIASKNQQVEFLSTTGFRNWFKLADGTTGWLGPDSEIKYMEEESGNRVVLLDGLAYFEVVHNNSPFIVKTQKKLNIKVIGTKFNISAYSSHPSCEIVLESGKISLSNNLGMNVLMSPNERIVYHPDDNRLEKMTVDATDFSAWTKGRLVLKDIPINEACLKLSHFYNVEFEIRATNLDHEKVRLVLENESLEEALQLMSVIAPINCQLIDRKAMGDDSYSKKKIIITNR
ncbi:MAG: FecR family protein [Mangrovibacterium sp.]